MTGIEWLRTLHTKQLIELKNRCYKGLLGGGDIDCDGHVFNLEELKQVFSERPHIPNRGETNIIRRKSAKYKKRLHQSSQ
ncbi:hypothetical protein NIES267_22860 [Calothrix parasitica NIES-267]|uniref:Uncharacterized protein n=1 Tax=Calothrix parasitica NIES-267 TaxID=1973488 RepID=A0A1Z4LNJ2_9CYAN|nr:hypothetical protein NIES267_22860 [Calothrix parasitica NIES-267]